MKNLLFSLSLFVTFSFSISAQIIYIPAEYPTIQQGIDAALNGDTVLVDTGIYVERINFLGKNITIASSYLITLDTNYINQTIIDGDSLGSVVSIVSGEDSTALLCGFTIQNGADTIGGGICIINASPTIENSIITNNNVINKGGGIYIYNSNSHILNNKITDNSIYQDDNYCGQGGGIYILSSGGKIANTRIMNNSVYSAETGPYPGGGGICTSNSNTIFEDLFIYGNYSAVLGGVFYRTEVDSKLLLIHR